MMSTTTPTGLAVVHPFECGGGEGPQEFAIRSDKLLMGIFPLEWRKIPMAYDDECIDSYVSRLNDTLIKESAVFYKDVSRRRDRHIFRTFKLVHNGFDNVGSSAEANRTAMAR